MNTDTALLIAQFMVTAGLMVGVVMALPLLLRIAYALESVAESADSIVTQGICIEDIHR